MAYGARLLSGFGIKPVEGSNPSASALSHSFGTTILRLAADTPGVTAANLKLVSGWWPDQSDFEPATSAGKVMARFFGTMRP